VECRITSEDPLRNFLPSTGPVVHLELPTGPGVRWDGGIRAGFEVSLHYDPLLGKLVTWGPDRETAIDRMARALDELVVVGVETSTGFHRRVMQEGDFRAGDLSIRYLEEHPELTNGETSRVRLRAAAVAAALLEEDDRTRHRSPRIVDGGGAPAGAMPGWRRAGWPWRSR
jgi:acetyl-CoA carboxylase biotin carboxylase subunit